MTRKNVLLTTLFCFFSLLSSFNSFAQTDFDSPPKLLDKLAFNVDSISQWRIYYSKGNASNSTSQKRNVFAVSGDIQKLSDLKMKSDIKEMFSEINNAAISEKKIQNNITTYNGIPETISFRWQNENDNKFYRITILLTEEKNKKEKLMDYAEVNISIYANEPTVYLIKKTSLKKTIDIFNKFVTKDWGTNYETRP
ncbi:MAG TPA: hypothetical protein VKT28_08095 [Puia sp.]|nr:hypothetical protein [Puia sp.]